MHEHAHMYTRTTYYTNKYALVTYGTSTRRDGDDCGGGRTRLERLNARESKVLNVSEWIDYLFYWVGTFLLPRDRQRNSTLPLFIYTLCRSVPHPVCPITLEKIIITRRGRTNKRINVISGPSQKPGRQTHFDHHPYGNGEGRRRSGPVVQLSRMYPARRSLRKSGILHHCE